MAVLGGGPRSRAEAGEGGVVGLVAEPGVGKSRLCHEFAERCRAAGLEVFEAQARRTASRSPSCRYCRCCAPTSGSASATPTAASREKIAGRALLLDPGFAEDLPLIFDFLGVPDPDRPRPQMSAEARQRALGADRLPAGQRPQPRQHPGRLMIEDLHWIDAGSDAMLAELVASIEGTHDPGGGQLQARVLARLGAAPPPTAGFSLAPLGASRHA